MLLTVPVLVGTNRFQAALGPPCRYLFQQPLRLLPLQRLVDTKPIPLDQETRLDQGDFEQLRQRLLHFMVVETLQKLAAKNESILGLGHYSCRTTCRLLTRLG